MLIIQEKDQGRLAAPQRRVGARRAAHAVEFAMVGSVMVISILGLIEMGRGLMVQHLLTSAARQGCRVGVIPGKSNADITAAATTSLASQGVNGDAATVNINGGNGDASSAKTGDEITVIVTVQASSVTWVPGVRFLNGSISGQYSLRHE